MGRGRAPLQGDQRTLRGRLHFKIRSLPAQPRPTKSRRRVRARALSGWRRRARARLRGQPPAADDAAQEEAAAAAAARSGGLKRRPAATGRRRNELGGRPRLGAVRGSGPGVGGSGAAGGQRSFLAAAAAAVAMRGTARSGPPRRGRLPGARGLRVPPPPPLLLLLLALLSLLPAPGAAAAPAPRPPALQPAAAGPSVSLYLSEDEVRRLIGEWGRLRRGEQVRPGPGCFRPPVAQSARGRPWAVPLPGPWRPHPVPAPQDSCGPRPLPAVLAGRCGPCPASAPGQPSSFPPTPSLPSHEKTPRSLGLLERPGIHPIPSSI